MKTSQSHPFPIKSVEAGNGEIGLTFCPGKKQQKSFDGPWDRDLDLDLKEIQDWGGVALLTLIEDHEFQELEVVNLGEKAEAVGLEWHHLPVKDHDIPREEFEHMWKYSGRRLRSLLQGGDKIVVHCMGGLGRTGTIAGRLMVELGANADDAIRSIRKARPNSIETPEQERYVRRQSPIGDKVDIEGHAAP